MVKSDQSSLQSSSSNCPSPYRAKKLLYTDCTMSSTSALAPAIDPRWARARAMRRRVNRLRIALAASSSPARSRAMTESNESSEGILARPRRGSLSIGRCSVARTVVIIGAPRIDRNGYEQQRSFCSAGRFSTLAATIDPLPRRISTGPRNPSGEADADSIPKKKTGRHGCRQSRRETRHL